jgi:hypothetical protein
MFASSALRRARFERARWWLALGVAVLPLKPRSKHLQPGFGPHQSCITDPDVARRWFLDTNANLGVVLGGSAGLVVADWDDAAAYLDWRTTLGAHCNSLTERTDRGYHVFFFASGLSSATAGACELKSRGACMVAPSIHPAGMLYCVVHPAPIASLYQTQARSLFPFLSPPTAPKIPDVHTRPSITSPPAGLLTRVKAARSISDEMLAAGIQLRPAGPNTLVGLCPFHDDHSPSLWVYPHSGLWGCNRPDCVAAGTHDVINFRARWRGISNRAAIRQLADELL